MAPIIYRLTQLWNRNGRPGLWNAGKTKVCTDYLFRDSAEPYVPGTTVKRATVTYLGPKLPTVTAAEAERLPRELGEFYAHAKRAERPQPEAKSRARDKRAVGVR
jgi:hypothetical protein